MRPCTGIRSDRLPLVGAHLLGIGHREDLHHVEYLLLGGAWLQVWDFIECVNFEEVSMNLPGRRTGSVVTNFAGAVCSLLGTIRQLLLTGHALFEFARGGG